MLKLIALCSLTFFIFSESCVTAIRPQSGSIENQKSAEPTVAPTRPPCVSGSPNPTPRADRTIQNHAMESLIRGAGSHKEPWQPANFRGLRIGTADIEALVTVLGKPESIAENGPDLIYRFEICDEINGNSYAWVDKNSMILKSIAINPESMPLTEILKTFGSDYVITRYNFDNCLAEGDGAPIYEDPNGSLEYVEYRSKGIAILVNDDGSVQEIEYLSKPLGAQYSRCP